jgi:hypothetical protein
MQIIIHIVGSVVLFLCGVVIGHNMRDSSHKHHPAPQDSDLALCTFPLPYPTWAEHPLVRQHAGMYPKFTFPSTH